MVNFVKAKNKFADGSVSIDTHYLFVERNYKNPAYGEWIYRNVHGGFCTKDCIEVVESGIFTGTKERLFTELVRLLPNSYKVVKL